MKCVTMTRVVLHIAKDASLNEMRALERAGYQYTGETDLDDCPIWDKEVDGLMPGLQEGFDI